MGYRSPPPSALDDLLVRVDELAAAGLAPPWGAEASLAVDTEQLAVAARTMRGLFTATTSAVLVQKVRCAAEAGVVLVVAEGNSKDEGTLVAAAAIVVAFAEAFGVPLLYEADILPALRRAMLQAHDDVRLLAELPVDPGRFGTCAGQRTSLRSIGASVAAVVVLPSRAWCVAVGECPIWLLRAGDLRRLSLPNTLANDPGYRAAIRDDPDRAIDFADGVLTRVIGMDPEPPQFNVTRLDIRPGDRIVLGNEWVNEPLPAVAAGSVEGRAADLCRGIVAALEEEPAPIPITVAVAARI